MPYIGETEGLPLQEHDCLTTQATTEKVKGCGGTGEHLRYQESTNMTVNSPGKMGTTLGALSIYLVFIPDGFLAHRLILFGAALCPMMNGSGSAVLHLDFTSI